MYQHNGKQRYVEENSGQHEMRSDQVKSLLPGTQQSCGCGLITRRSQVQILPPPLSKPWSATMAGQGFVVLNGRCGERCTNHVPRRSSVIPGRWWCAPSVTNRAEPEGRRRCTQLRQPASMSPHLTDQDTQRALRQNSTTANNCRAGRLAANRQGLSRWYEPSSLNSATLWSPSPVSGKDSTPCDAPHHPHHPRDQTARVEPSRSNHRPTPGRPPLSQPEDCGGDVARPRGHTWIGSNRPRRTSRPVAGRRVTFSASCS